MAAKAFPLAVALPGCPKRSVLTRIGAETFVPSSLITEEPAATVGSSTAGGMNETGDFGGEALPECGVESCRTENETLLGSSEIEWHTFQVVGNFAVDPFMRCRCFPAAHNRIP